MRGFYFKFYHKRIKYKNPHAQLQYYHATEGYKPRQLTL